EEVPLRHESNKLAVRRQMCEIGNAHDFVANLSREFAHFLMWQFEEFLQESEFVHQFERGGMNRVPTKVAQEIFVLFKNDYIHTGARKKKSQHHAGRPTSSDTATRLNNTRHR